MKTLFAGASLIAIVTLGVPLAAQAQEQSTAVEELLVTGNRDLGLNTPTETGSRLGLTPLETPASVTVLSGATIRARGDLSIGEAISRAPGITSLLDAGSGNTALVARGFVGHGSVLQLVDGVRLFPTAGTISFPTDPWNVERIDVLSGPASVLYGQGSLGGAINIVTKKPSDMTRYDLEASYGSDNTIHLAAGAGGPLGDQLAYRADVSYRSSDGWIERGDSDSLAIGAALRYTPTEDLTFTLRADYGVLNPTQEWGTPLIGGKIDERIRYKNYNVSDADIHYQDDRLTLGTEWRINDAVSFSNQVYRLSNDRTWYNLDSFCHVAANGDCRNFMGSGTPGMIVRSSNLGIIHDTVQYGDQGSFKISTPLGGLKNDLVLGFDVNQIKLDYSHNFAFATQVDEVDPFNFTPGTLQNRADTIPRYFTKTKEWSVYAEDRLELNDQFSLVGGFRYEEDRVQRHNYVYTGNAITGSVTAFPNGAADKKFDNFTWRAGAVYQPRPNLSLYAQYSTGVDPLGTLTTVSASASQFAFTNATGRQAEVGAKATFLQGRGSATVAVYQIVKEDLVAQRTPASPTIEQIGQQSSEGIEASLSLPLGETFQLEANGTILDAKYDNFVSGGTIYTGNTPPMAPESAANVWLTWSGVERFRVQAGLRYVGSRYSDNANTFKVPSYTVVDASVSYAVTPKVAVDLRFYNLFDEVYAASVYYDEQWILGRPRAFDIAVRAKF